MKRRLFEKGLEKALERKEPDTPRRAKKLDGKGEAHLIAIACSKTPTGRNNWTLKMLAEELVTLEVVDTISSVKKLVYPSRKEC